MTTLGRRALIGALAVTPALAGHAVARAPLGGVDIVAPAGPGGGYDQLARTVQQVLEAEKLATSVQVTNVPGAGGTVGLAQFVTGKRRGNQLLVVGLGLVGAVLVNKSAVSLADVAPLARMTGEHEVLVTAAGSPVASLGDLVARFKEAPGSVTWGGFALGSPDHIVAGLLAKAVGVEPAKLNYVVAGAGGEMLAQVMGGHLTVGLGGYNEFSQQIRAGKLRALGISSAARVPGIDVPTFTEQGVAVELVNWRGLMTTAAMPASGRRALEDTIGAVVATPAWQSLLAERGWIDMHQSGPAFASFLAEERGRVEGVLRETGLVK